MKHGRNGMMRRNVLTGLAGAAATMASGSDLWGRTMKEWYVPAEDDPHERTFLQWPVDDQIYREAWFLEEVQQAIVTLANAIASFEPVVVLAAAEHHEKIRQQVGENVALWDIPTDDLWARDSGPLFVVHDGGGLAVRHVNFNGWGGKQRHPNDGLVARRVAERMGLPLLDNGLVGEPGGVEQDGHGTLMAHESSWVNPNRNPGIRAAVEAQLLEAYGAQKMIWAPGLAGQDITDFHIDALARFVAPGRVIIQMPGNTDMSDDWVRTAHQTRSILAEATDAKGRRLQITEIYDPERPRVRDPDFLASYVNYYVCNGAVIMAQFGDDDADSEAIRTIGQLYPDREVVTLNTDALGWIGGGIHCATQQQPAV
ncbi:agmatine deiminase family protein [Pseudaestuariivita rosea]|uniref:agmatine deiminase family protein n=1 Tax=Pseudaestuariivita rosea TaxID=2763263 RepID=UPI001F2AAA9D|nr:agmatine deiminase family protein [Pseudaestuariivita rosea]